MSFNSATYSVRQNGDDTYNIIRDYCLGDDGKPWVEIESLKADEDGITMLPEGGILVKSEETMTLYATERVNNCNYYDYGRLCKFLEGILDYRFFGDVFLFKTVEGWFFFFYEYEFWYISDEQVMKERLESITKLCDSDVQVMECKVLNVKMWSNEHNGYMVITSNGKFLLYDAPGSVIGASPQRFVRINRYSKVPGYEDLIKIYLNSGKRFFLATLATGVGRTSYQDSPWYKPEMLKKVTYIGKGFLLAEYGQKSKLFFCPDGHLPTTVIDWGIHSIKKVESHYGGKFGELLCTKWLVDDGVSQYIVERKFQTDCCIIPKLK